MLEIMQLLARHGISFHGVQEFKDDCLTVHLTYRIMQIVRGGKVSRLHGLLVIRSKTFAIVWQFKAPYNKKEKIRC